MNSVHFFLPSGISAKEWGELTPLGRILVEAGMYLTEAELLPRQLYIEHLLSKVDLKDKRDPGQSHKKNDISRMELKLFLQFLRRLSSGAYKDRVIAVAEARQMRLSLDEDGASLYMDRLLPDERNIAHI